MNKLFVNKFLISIKQNGFGWTLCRLGKRYSPFAKNYFENKLEKIEATRNIPGLNTFEQNYRFWNDYDWSGMGEEWSVNEEWKKKLVELIIIPEINPGDIVVEIGPGTGRMTEHILKLSSKLICVDISAKCIEVLKEKFRANENIKFHHIEKVDLSFIPENSIDKIFSYDVFVHIDKEIFTEYFKEFKRILKNDGSVIIHYNKAGEREGTFFSKFTETDFNELCKQYGFNIVKDFDPYRLREYTEEEDSSYQSISILKKI